MVGVIFAFMDTKYKISTETVENVAQLAHLKLTEEEKQRFTEQLQNILGNFEKLDELDVENVPPMTHATPILNRFREDVVQNSLSLEEALKNAEETKEGYFKAQKIV